MQSTSGKLERQKQAFREGTQKKSLDRRIASMNRSHFRLHFGWPVQ